VCFNCFHSVAGAAWVKPAVIAQEWAEQGFVAGDQKNNNSAH